MTIDEYKQKAKEIEDWAPGWDAIDSCMEKRYGNQEPKHYGTNMAVRAIFGGDQYLDGYSVYTSQYGHLHIVTYGMSELYTNEESFGGEFSKWGYEMTLKLPLCEEADYLWALDMLSNLARYTFTSKRYLEPNQYISGGGNPIKVDSGSKLTGLLVVEDTELAGTNTVHGRLDFIQLVGITQTELDAIMADQEKIPSLIASMKQDNPLLVTDIARTKDYLNHNESRLT
ncbi:MAG: suppressor of fused domain protein [Clostridiales Family XIII bacterium]|nr:suppressor of fused domain protein [Clostridiales Family XIII bacterium]